MTDTIREKNAAPMPEANLESLPFEPLPALQMELMESDAALAARREKRIGILVVTSNASPTLLKVLKRITPNVWENVEEIAVFDDGSQDATYELAMGLKMLRNLPKLNVLRHSKVGYGGNQKAGYRYFMEKGFDIVVLLHGDGEYAPEILSHLYHPIVSGEADAVFGSRMMRQYGGPLKGGMPLYKYLGNRILSTFENRALGLNLNEFHSGYRAYNLSALRKIDFSQMTDDFHFDTELIVKLHHQHYTIREVPIPTYYGKEIQYVNGLAYARNVVRAIFRYNQTRRSVSCYPEFREYFIHYPIKESKGSSHHYVQQMAGTHQEILDLGCGQAVLAAKLKKNGNRVTGVDVLAEATEKGILERYFSANLDEGIEPVVAELQGKRFDRVLLIDVLEHLRHPERILQQCHEVLKWDGHLIISVPNVANLTVRLMLLLGQFNYTQRGILDKTHIWFFTRKTARRFVEQNGYKIVQERATVMPLELALGLSPANPLMRAANFCLTPLTRLLPGLFGYQIMFVARSQRAAETPLTSQLSPT
jgi:2-polyprenyl-3-methyl-5-hydroxy-6-metoxy-1,4-benzoquinol methylase